jgi:tetratricopeptide (TPR) repeat protein
MQPMSLTRRVTAVALGLALLALSGPLRAQSSNESRAHDAFVLGQAAFNEARYDDALAQFQSAFALSGRAELLVTLAQTYRKLGRFDDALASCERFLGTKPPPARERSTYEFMGQLRAERASANSAVAPRPNDARPTAPPSTTTAGATPAASGTLIAGASPAAGSTPDRRHKLLIGLAVAAGVVVLAVGLGVGLGVGLSHSDQFPSSGLGTVGFSH